MHYIRYACKEHTYLFNLEWHGGGKSASSNYRVNGTIGQSLASPPAAGGATYRVTGGYWVFDSRMDVYLPAVTKP